MVCGWKIWVVFVTPLQLQKKGKIRTEKISRWIEKGGVIQQRILLGCCPEASIYKARAVTTATQTIITLNSHLP